MHDVYIAVGSNQGNKELNISSALKLLDVDPNIEVISISTLIETVPVGGPDGQDNFLNGVFKIKTSYEPDELLQYLNFIENKLGRVRTVRNAPRTVDLDILLFDELILETEKLTIPHPRMFERDFVLIPFLEIAPNIINQNKLVIPYKDQIQSILCSNKLNRDLT